jgi:hypothetical protein
MRETDLPSPNMGETGFHLRRVVVRAINYLKRNERAFHGEHPAAPCLVEFLEASLIEARKHLPPAAETL